MQPLINRATLAELYKDWVNNYASPKLWAEHLGLTEDEGDLLLKLARSCFINAHPDA